MKITECEWGKFFRYTVLASHPEYGVGIFNGIIDLSNEEDDEVLSGETIRDFYLRAYDEVTKKISDKYCYFFFTVEFSSFVYNFSKFNAGFKYYFGKVVDGELVESRLWDEA